VLVVAFAHVVGFDEDRGADVVAAVFGEGPARAGDRRDHQQKHSIG
jgi:hypothetical protein